MYPVIVHKFQLKPKNNIIVRSLIILLKEHLTFPFNVSVSVPCILFEVKLVGLYRVDSSIRLYSRSRYYLFSLCLYLITITVAMGIMLNHEFFVSKNSVISYDSTDF